MGIFRKERTHESRSSSISFAMRWRHENLRQISIAGILTVAVITIILVWLFRQNDNKISLVAGSKVQPAETEVSKVDQRLDEHSMSLPLNDSSNAKERFVAINAVPVKVSVDGATKVHFTKKSNVKGAISELGLALNKDDKIEPALNSPISSNLDIQIVRVSKHTVQKKEALPFAIVKTADGNLLKGKTKVLQQGTQGLVVHNIEKVYEDGKFVTKRWVGKEVAKAAQPKVIAVGTKKPPEVQSANITRSSSNVRISGLTTKGGVSFNYKTILKNVTLTAYSSEEDGIGTKTASGTRVMEGRTIAVDDSVVPMGWWVYIEGIGFRKAEDTGGAIDGHKIDVYYDTLKAATNFGVKKGRTVYVIGPNKPELN